MPKNAIHFQSQIRVMEQPILDFRLWIGGDGNLNPNVLKSTFGE